MQTPLTEPQLTTLRNERLELGGVHLLQLLKRRRRHLLHTLLRVAASAFARLHLGVRPNADRYRDVLDEMLRTVRIDARIEA